MQGKGGGQGKGGLFTAGVGCAIERAATRLSRSSLSHAIAASRSGNSVGTRRAGQCPKMLVGSSCRARRSSRAAGRGPLPGHQRPRAHRPASPRTSAEGHASRQRGSHSCRDLGQVRLGQSAQDPARLADRKPCQYCHHSGGRIRAGMDGKHPEQPRRGLVELPVGQLERRGDRRGAQPAAVVIPQPPQFLYPEFMGQLTDLECRVGLQQRANDLEGQRQPAADPEPTRPAADLSLLTRSSPGRARRSARSSSVSAASGSNTATSIRRALSPASVWRRGHHHAVRPCAGQEGPDLGLCRSVGDYQQYRLAVPGESSSNRGHGCPLLGGGRRCVLLAPADRAAAHPAPDPGCTADLLS